MGVMGRNVQPDQAQRFEQAIATMFTCRSVIKYNAALNEEQINELLAEIDAAAQFLQERLVANVAKEKPASLLMPQLPLEDIISISQTNRVSTDDSESAGETADQALLQRFYKLYYALLKKKDNKGVEFFISRYNEVMVKLNDVQFKIEKDAPIYFNHLMLDDDIDHIRGFVTDLYCMFTEFASAIVGVVEGHDMYIDTEKVSSTQQPLDREQQPNTFDIAPLIKAQQTQAQFNRRNGILADRVADASALLILLEDRLDPRLEKREVIVAQINSLIRLLNNIALLLTRYEQTISSLLTQVG